MATCLGTCAELICAAPTGETHGMPSVWNGLWNVCFRSIWTMGWSSTVILKNPKVEIFHISRIFCEDWRCKYHKQMTELLLGSWYEISKRSRNKRSMELAKPISRSFSTRIYNQWVLRLPKTLLFSNWRSQGVNLPTSPTGWNPSGVMEQR